MNAPNKLKKSEGDEILRTPPPPFPLIPPSLPTVKAFASAKCLLANPIRGSGSLRQLVENHYFDWSKDPKQFAKEIATGISYLHSRQIIYGDLSSDNVCYLRKSLQLFVRVVHANFYYDAWLRPSPMTGVFRGSLYKRDPVAISYHISCYVADQLWPGAHRASPGVLP